MGACAAHAAPAGATTAVTGYVGVSYAYGSGTVTNPWTQTDPGNDIDETSLETFHASVSGWTVDGAASLSVTGIVGAQVDLSYSNFRNSIHWTETYVGCPACSTGASYTAHGDGTAATGHLFARTDGWLAGAFAGVSDQGFGRLMGGGVEGQLYLGRWTLQGAAGAATLKSDESYGSDYAGGGASSYAPLFWSGRLDVRYFVTDDLSLGVNGGYMDGRNDFTQYGGYYTMNEHGPGLWTVGVTGEVRLRGLPVSLFVAYEHGGSTSGFNQSLTSLGGDTEAETDGFRGSDDAVRVGVRWTFGGSLFDRDRHGSSLNSFRQTFGDEFEEAGEAIVTGADHFEGP